MYLAIFAEINNNMPFSNAKIYNLKSLISALKIITPNDSYTKIMSEINFGFKEIEHLCFWDNDNYSKISIEKDELYELVLICWEKEQQSPIHKHNLTEAWTYILKGELTEKIYVGTEKNPPLENTIILTQKDISSIKKESKKVHRLINSYNGRSVSLHLYKK